MVPAQPGQKVPKTLFQPVAGHSGVCLSSQRCGEAQIGGQQSKLTRAYSETLSQN
jgi:hypothetical protein